MSNYWKMVNSVINSSDVILLILDARFPEETRNREIEEKIKKTDKKLLYVINKCDLVSKKDIEELRKKIKPSMFVSSTKRFGASLLHKKILEISKGGTPVVGVLGYPNVGKSSVINLLKGKKSASVSSTSGHTKALQHVRARGKIKLIDTPGVLAYMETDRHKQVIIGSINPHQLTDPESHAIELVLQYPYLFEKEYGIRVKKDDYECIEKIALHKNMLKKGGEPDTKRMAVQILYDWQKGKIHGGE